MQIKNNIYKSELIDWRKVNDLQPDTLKSYTNIAYLRESILKHGISKAYDVCEIKGKLYWLDGHTRTNMFETLESEGINIPKLLMANFCEVKNKAEAIKILLEVHNQKLNKINTEVLTEWLEVEEIEIEEINVDSLNVEWVQEEEEDEDGEDNVIEAHQKLTDTFIVPPFSILDTRQGYWQERKKYWRELIGDNGESRENTLHNSESSEKSVMNAMSSVSLLDPVLSELVNLWFGLPKSKTFDCFAGDSVFGYVSSYLGNNFTGIELRQEQTDLNNARVKGFKANYVCDDGRNVLNHIKENTQDLLFSCPPYFDLEVYSDLPNDASNQKEYSDFLNILNIAFSNAIKCLKDNRFAVITVGDVRDKNGFYYRFVDDIKDIFKANGLLLYNELILVESIGTLPQRVGKFMLHRKIGKCHQNVLVFYKGNPKEIKTIFPKIENIEDGSTDV